MSRYPRWVPVGPHDGTLKLAKCDEGTVGLTVPFTLLTHPSLSVVPWMIYTEDRVGRRAWCLNRWHRYRCLPAAEVAGWDYICDDGHGTWSRDGVPRIEFYYPNDVDTVKAAATAWEVEVGLSSLKSLLRAVVDSYWRVREDPSVFEQLMGRWRGQLRRELLMPKTGPALDEALVQNFWQCRNLKPFD